MVPPANAGDADSIPGLGRSPGVGRKWQLIPIFLPGKSHGQRNLSIVHAVAVGHD